MPLILMAEYPSTAAAVGTSVLGVVVIAAGFAVYKRKRWAAWGLVVFALIDVAARAVQGYTGYLMPALLFAFALTAAIKLGREA
jgi:hypothetical protein